MGESRKRPGGIVVAIPGRRAPLRVDHVLFDFSGTLAADGKLVRGVAPRLRRLAARVEVTVLTADTFGTARSALAGLPVAVHIVRGGAQKRRFVESLGGTHVAAVGNGVNDVPMLRTAALGVAVCGPEGLAAELVGAATIVVRDIRDALDLFLDPRRLVAVLRR